MLVPIAIGALMAAVLVAIASYGLGSQWASDELASRVQAIRQTLSRTTFPLNDSVLRSIAELTQTELVTVDSKGRMRARTLSVEPEILTRLDVAPDGEPRPIVIGDRRFVVQSFTRHETFDPNDPGDRVYVLVDVKLLDNVRRRAALLPLVTGLSTVLLLSAGTLALTSPLVRRMSRLQKRVEAVAHGDFASKVADNTQDELGRLGQAVDSMAGQLNHLWTAVNRQQSAKLLHQIASGMAHQLRNSLTGARMAIELHAGDCNHRDDDGIQVAIKQIEASEDYVRRLILVASGRQDEDRPAAVACCLHDLQSSLASIARHWKVPLTWSIAPELEQTIVRDGLSLSNAVSNLVLNALEAATEVRVDARLIHTPVQPMVQILVSDNGPGIAVSIQDELFEPFVSTKPEGLGLGLALVRRTAEYLGGHVEWRREQKRTTFRLTAAPLSTSPDSEPAMSTPGTATDTDRNSSSDTTS